jgi:hypothetical protein
MNQVIELPIWFIVLAAIGCYILGMIAEISAQRNSFKQQNKKSL